ncbi:MAG: T9SS type A sorting domain-containing protein [Saprospiraceae bacterium]|nr:T9SS type A sorting domain-containing protein [Saprospiraceae bacterium]
MIRFITLSFCLMFRASFAVCQILAGDTTGLLVNNSQETIQLNTPFMQFGDFVEDLTDSLDFNRDGRFDAQFTCGGCFTFDCNGGYTSTLSLHGSMEWMIDQDSFIAKLPANALISSQQLWKKANYSSFAYKVYGIFGLYQEGNWFSPPEGFAGLRIISNGDTLYGWAKIRATIGTNGAASLRILSWAIQNQPGVSANHEATPADEIQVFPNPFSNVINLANKSNGQVRIKLYNLYGQVIQDFGLLEPGASLRYITSHLPTAPYFMVWQQPQNFKKGDITLIKG